MGVNCKRVDGGVMSNGAFYGTVYIYIELFIQIRFKNGKSTFVTGRKSTFII